MVCTLLGSSNSMTFHDYFNDLFKFSKTLGLVVTFKNFQQTQTLGSSKMGAVCTV